MTENGIIPFPSADFATAVRYYERCCNLCPMSAACLGWCLKIGRDIPVFFIAAVECFKRAADSDDPDGANCFGCCLERGDGVDRDTGRAVSHYRRAASFGHADVLFNFGRCLEYGQPRFALRNITACPPKRETRLRRTVLGSAWSAALAFTKICPLRHSFIGALRTKAMRTAQTISDSASSTAAAFGKTLKWRWTITDSRPIAAIPKPNSTAPAAFACSANGSHPIALLIQFRIRRHPNVCLKSSAISAKALCH
jgi:hypothetical protein